MQVQWWGYHEVVGTLKPCHMLNNLFELIALKGSGDAKTLGASASGPNISDGINLVKCNRPLHSAEN